MLYPTHRSQINSKYPLAWISAAFYHKEYIIERSIISCRLSSAARQIQTNQNEAANHISVFSQSNLCQPLLRQLSPLFHSGCEIHPVMLKCFHLRRRGGSTCQPQAPTTLCFIFVKTVFNYSAGCANVYVRVILSFLFVLGLWCVKTSRQTWRTDSCSSSTFWLLCCKVQKTYTLVFIMHPISGFRVMPNTSLTYLLPSILLSSVFCMLR